MQFRERLKNDDSAVSPVIGVILMVAITVILAAVIASFVLGLGPDTATTPSASFDSDYDSGAAEITITMQSGNTIDAQNVEFTTDTTESTSSNILNATDSNGDVQDHTWSEVSGDDEITAGSSVTLDVSNVNADNTFTVGLVYVDGDTSSTLQDFEGST